MFKTLALTNPHMRGDEVTLAQKHLNKHLQHDLAVDGCFGPSTAHTCKTVKYKMGWPLKKCLPTYGKYFNDVLTGKVRLPLAFRIRARSRARRHRNDDSREATMRTKIVANLRWGVANRAQIHYHQWRPIDGLHTVRKLPLNTDCSGFVTDCYKWAGAPDPNGLGYNGQGYTGSLLNHMHHITKDQAKPGDLVVFGAYPGDHVAALVEHGSVGDPKTIGNGSEPDPAEYPVSVVAAAVSHTVSYLTLPKW